jgi:hypothetical protein
VRDDGRTGLLTVQLHVEKMLHSAGVVSPFSDVKFKRTMISFADDLRT